MPLSTPATFKAATDHLGVAYTAILATLDAESSTSTISGVADFRTAVRAALSDDVDSNDILADSARGIELAIPVTIGGALNDVATGLENYCQEQFETSMRAYFKDTINDWDDGFRALWRYAQAEEIIVRLGVLTRGVAVWTYVADTTIELDTAMEIRVVSLNALSDVVVNLTMSTAAGTHYLATARIPVGSAPGAKIALVGGPAKYTSVYGLTISGGTDTDELEIWLV